MVKRIISSVMWLGMLLLLPIGAQSLEPPHDASNNIDCSHCHAMHKSGMFGSIIPQGAEQEALCKSCHNPTGQAAATSKVANHLVQGGSTIIDCGACHDPHSPDITIDPHTGVESPNLKLIRESARDVTGALDLTIFQESPANFAFAEDNPPWNGICQSCHTQTAYHTNDNSTDHQHKAGSNCTACHTHENGFMPTVHPESTSDCNKCHFNKQTGQPDLTGIHSDNCQLCHTEGSYDKTFLGSLGTWDNQCNTCHNASISQTGNYPAHKQGHRCVLCHGGERDIPDSAVYDTVRLHNDHSKNANCVVCHGFIPNTGVQIGSGNRDNCALCHGQGAYSSSGINEIHEGMVKQGLSCLECHFDQRPPIDVATGPPVGNSTVICQICHTNESPSEFTNDMDGMHKKHLRMKLECGECHIDAILQDDRVPMPTNVDDSRRALIDRADYNECSFCHGGSKGGSLTTVHRKHHKDQWQWCYNCHEGSDQRPIGTQPPVTQPSEACDLCHGMMGKQYNDTFPFDIHYKHGKKAKCYACHQGTPPIFNWPDSWR